MTQSSPAYYISLPTLNLYATFQYDAVRHGGEEVGVSQWASYSPNARHVISTALVDIAQSEPGTEVTLLWGEPNSKRAAVDAHEVREIRATVAPVPYFEKLIRTGKQ